ncbi:hypothetical protein V0288_17985 [Pannus brasiliensis CCIBt3594]|uniref:Uncharacterized protein n=1 Tax=Pannus brasiliensis CCIBt3594 TaxID=1427578 RepID=A0AAW9QXT8_9CHRO
MIAEPENDLKRLEELIINGQKAIETRLTSIENDFAEMKVEIKDIREGIRSLEIGQAKLIEKAESADRRLQIVEGTQSKQIWTLITLLGGSLIAVAFRSFFTGNNP